MSAGTEALSCEKLADPYEKLTNSYEKLTISYEKLTVSYEMPTVSYELPANSYEKLTDPYETMTVSHDIKVAWQETRDKKRRVPGHPSSLVYRYGGDEGDRTPDLCNAIAALSQLSYVPPLKRETAFKQEF